MNIWKIGAFNLLALSLVALHGCNSLRQEVNPDRLNRESAKLVVNCFLSPQDTVLAVKVTRSLPVLGETSTFSYMEDNVTDATVTLTEGSRSAVLRYDPKLRYYRAAVSQLPIMAGRTYSVAVQTPTGEQATANTTIPEQVAVTDIVLDSAVTKDFGLTTKNYYARLRWRDPAGKPNFYQVMGNNEYAYVTKYQPSPKAPLRDTVYQFQGIWYFDGGSTNTDVGRDGQVLESTRARLSIRQSWTNGKQDPSRPVGPLNAYLLNLNEAYFRYRDAIERQNQVGDNPFAEPVLIPTNIQGGFGCFAGYNRSTLTINLK